MSSVLDLPIERQRELAKLEGFSDVTAWQQHTRQQFAELDRETKSIEKSKVDRKEIEQKIHDLQTNPYAIEFYRRITDDYELTTEQQIAYFRSLL